MPLARFIESIRLSQILDPEQLDELTVALTDSCSDPESLATELLQRNWLTTFQVELLLAGRARELARGQYIILERLGEGGMGTVFKARHRLMDRVVAMKVIRGDLVSNPTTVSRFRREIRTAARLSHPHIVLAYDAASVGDTHFFVMEYVEGTDLERLVLQRGPLPVAQAASYARQAALGLQYAHEKGLVHRDVKPSNLLLSVHEALVKLVDLGLARLRESPTNPGGALTVEGAPMGTPDFIAPEQAENPQKVDIRADIYSLGCTLYFLLARQPPFPEGTWLQKIRQHMEDEPVPLECLRPDIPVELAETVRRAMARSPEDRFQDPASLAAALEPFCRGHRPLTGLGTLAESTGLLPSTLGEGHLLVTPSEEHRAPRTKILPRWVVNQVGTLLVLVPAGRFLMGSPPTEEDRQEDEGPQREVEITRSFYMGVYPVKQREFLAVMGRNPSLFNYEGGGGPDFPVENVLWQDAVDFCKRLSERPEEKLAGRVYRLPTEAEWEYACRAGTTTAFALGDSLSSFQANFDGRNPYGGAQNGPNLRRTSRVGSFPDNVWGLYDMHGNVWEWCSDWYQPDYYESAPPTDPTGPDNGHFRVVRGGSWHFYGAECRSAFRGRGSPDFRLSVGFRVVLVPNLGTGSSLEQAANA
jgi:eukaryotic-like serine/threonine-protein kinase